MDMDLTEYLFREGGGDEKVVGLTHMVGGRKT